MKAVELIAFLWATAWVCHAGRRLLEGDRNSLLIVYLIFYAEYAFPLGLDLVIGRPAYSAQPGFATASQAPDVRLLYCAFLFLVPLVWLWNARKQNRASHIPSRGWVVTVLRLGSALPVLFVLVAPEPRLYLEYAGVIRSNAAIDILIFHIVVSMATMVAVLCAAGRCLIGPLSKKTMTEVAIAIAVSIWINGKRYIVAEALMFVVLAVWYRGAVNGKKLAGIMLAGVTLLAVFSLNYQSNIRGISFDSISGQAAGEDARVDYTRDSRVKMAIYSELHPKNMQILDHVGQNCLYYLTLLVPRSLWENKPYPYADYFTSAMLNRYPQHLGWGMTTGVFDETIANLGLLGILVGPLLIRRFCTVGDSVSAWSVHILTCVIGCLLLSVQIAAFTPLIVIWIVAVIKTRHIHFWEASTVSRTGPCGEVAV